MPLPHIQPPQAVFWCVFHHRLRTFPGLSLSIVQGPEENQEAKLDENGKQHAALSSRITGTKFAVSLTSRTHPIRNQGSSLKDFNLHWIWGQSSSETRQAETSGSSFPKTGKSLSGEGLVRRRNDRGGWREAAEESSLQMLLCYRRRFPRCKLLCSYPKITVCGSI